MSDHDLHDLPEEDDYLWDPEAPADEAIAELEAQLRPLAFDRPAPAFDAVEPAPAATSRWWLLAAAAVLLVVGWALARRAPEPAPEAHLPIPTVAPTDAPTPAPTATMAAPAPSIGWDLAVVGGAPTCDGEVVDDETRLRPGTWLETNADARAQLKVPELGTVEVGVDTRLRIVSTTKGKHVVELTRGTAFVTLEAPPEAFVTKTRFGDIVDLGCRYVAAVDDERLTVEVTSGAVAIRRADGELRIDEGFGATATASTLGPARALDAPPSKSAEPAPPPAPPPAVWDAPPTWTPEDGRAPDGGRGAPRGGRERSPE